jgi:hypothetical protein
MDPNRLEMLLGKRRPDPRGRTPDCPDEHQVAAYVDGGLGATERQQLERHLADCAHCLDLVGLLCRERGSETASEPARPEILRSARNQGPMRRPWRFAPSWAAAAAVIVVVPLLLQLSRNLDAGQGGPGRPESPATRALATGRLVLEVVAEPADSPLDARRPAFRWSEVTGSPYYDVRIVTDAGDVIARDRVNGTRWRTPEDLDLRPGAAYFIRVDGYPAGAKAVSSGHVPFAVDE